MVAIVCKPQYMVIRFLTFLARECWHRVGGIPSYLAKGVYNGLPAGATTGVYWGIHSGWFCRGGLLIPDSVPLGQGCLLLLLLLLLKSVRGCFFKECRVIGGIHVCVGIPGVDGVLWVILIYWKLRVSLVSQR